MMGVYVTAFLAVVSAAFALLSSVWGEHSWAICAGVVALAWCAMGLCELHDAQGRAS